MRAAVVPAVGLMLLTAACGDGSSSSATPQPSTGRESISVTSSAFSDGEPLSVGFTCDGAGVSPPLEWRGVPAAAQSLALVVADPDAPGGTFYHWLVVDIPTTVDHLTLNESPEGGVVAKNSDGDTAYTGPCPPSGTHHYRFTIYALSKPTGLPAGADVSSTVDAIGTRAIASGTLIGTYARD